MTKFAIVSYDSNYEWGGSRKGFIPVDTKKKGKRYISFSNAVGVANDINTAEGYNPYRPVRVIETLF